MPKVNSMSIQDYLILKLNLVKKFNHILNKNIPMIKGISQLNHQFIFNMENIGNNQIYFNLRLLNYAYSVFSDLDCIMVLTNQDDNAIKELMKIIAQDFHQNLAITVISSEDTDLLKAKNALGFLFNTKQFKELTTETYEHKVIIGHSDALDLAHKLGDMLQEEYNGKLDIEYVVVNPTAGSHCGPDCIGVCFYAKHK